MQWLIDIIKEWIGLNAGYFFRGDISAWDFTLVDFVRDENWHELDLSAIVPEGAKAVLLKVVVESVFEDKKFDLRAHGQIYNYNTCAIFTPKSSVRIGGVYLVPCDADRKIDYEAYSTGFTTINVIVVGWFL